MKTKASKRKPPRKNFGHNQAYNSEHSESRIAEAEASTFLMRQRAGESMSYPQPSCSGIISHGMENSVGSFYSTRGCVINVEKTNTRFLEANGSCTIATYAQLGGSSVMSNKMGSSGEIIYQHSGNSFQSFQPGSNNVLGIHDPPITGMSSTE